MVQGVVQGVVQGDSKVGQLGLQCASPSLEDEHIVALQVVMQDGALRPVITITGVYLPYLGTYLPY